MSQPAIETNAKSIPQTNRYNLMPKSTWDVFKEMGLERAIHTIYAISEYNRTCEKPLLIPGSYIRQPGFRPTYLLSGEFPCLHPDSKFLLLPGRGPSYSYCLMNELIPNCDKMSFDGYVIAGGAALKTVVGFSDYGRMDADFYPLYSPNAFGTQYERIMVSYVKWLDDCDAILTGGKLRIQSIAKGEHTTTVSLQFAKSDVVDGDKALRSYQMIHRAYRSPEEVIVGFDQPCCKAFFDGNETYLTLDCALCIHYGINPIDWRAESPTHIKRTLKYLDRSFRWVAPKFPDLKPKVDFRFAAGLISQLMNGNIKLYEQTYHNFVVENHGEFPIPSHQSAYQSDYEPKFIDNHIMEGYDLPVEEKPEGYKTPLSLVNLRAAATDNPTYFVAYTNTFSDFIANRFRIANFENIIDRQEYREYFMHRKRMMEIFAEISKIQDRIQMPKQPGCFKHAGMDAPRPHRFQIDQANRYIELCQEAKQLSSEYLSKVNANQAIMLKRREIVNFRFDNPGAQITASFHPIKRKSHADYWGVNAMPITYRRVAWDQIRSLLILMKRKEIPQVPKDVLRIIRRLLFDHFLTVC